MEALMTPGKAVSPSLFGANLQLNGTLRHLSFTWTKRGADGYETRHKASLISQTTIRRPIKEKPIHGIASEKPTLARIPKGVERRS